MAAHVLRLRAALLVGAFRGPDGLRRLIGFGALVAGAAVLIVRALALGDLPTQTVVGAVSLAGALVIVLSAALPLFTAAEDPLDPRRFRTLDIGPLPLTAALLLSTIVSVPTWLVAAFDVVAAVLWTRAGAHPAAAVVGALCHLLTCVVLARIVMAVKAIAGAGGRVADGVGVAIASALAIFAPAVLLTASLWGAATLASVDRIVAAVSFTPLGAWAAAPATTIGGGSPGAALAVAVATVAALLIAWAWLVRRLLHTVEHPVVARGGAGLGWFALLPATAAGAIAARSLVYGLRDSRYIANVLVIPFGGVLPILPLLVAGVPLEIAALVPVPLMALLYGWLPHNDLAYDSSAVWLHIATGARGASDRIGRLAPVTLAAVPVLAVAVPAALLVSGRPDLLPALVGSAVALLLAGFGLSSIASVVAPYAVARPGDGPFRQPQRTDATGAWSQSLVLIGSLLLSGPTLWLAGQAVAGVAADPLVVLWTGLGTGSGVLLLGVAIGAAAFDARGTRIMEFAGAT
ncbi:hypothetical protein [Microbacterium gilvum]|uniref:ABC-2 type transport system permease protein n=1 Tax=Microbacterium gilvum TaxID=1336204 RepID=A0ABP8ZQU3_9MICO